MTCRLFFLSMIPLLVTGATAPACLAETSSAANASRQENTPKQTEKAEPKPAQKKPGMASGTKQSVGPVNTDREAFEALAKDAIAKWNNVTTLSTRIVTTDVTTAATVPLRREGGGFYDLRNKDGKSLVRVQLREGRIQDASGPEVDLTARMTTVCDGEAVYHLRESVADTQAVKLPLDQGNQLELGGPRLFNKLRRYDRVKVLPAEKMDGREVCVINVSPESGNPSVTYRIDIAKGLLRKITIRDLANRRDQTVSFIDWKFGVEFPDDYFVFIPPEGVEVRDMTAPPSQKGGSR